MRSNPHALHLLAASAEISALRDTIAERARALEGEYEDRREALAGGFCSLNLSVQIRNQGRSVQIYWTLWHFKNGKRSGITMVPKPKSSRHFDIAALRRNSPDWIHELVEEIELRARPLRESLSKLTEVDRDLRVVANRLEIDMSQSLTPSDEDGQEDAHASGPDDDADDHDADLGENFTLFGTP